MISFEKFRLDNGLEIVVHPDPNSTIVCLNILYKVGSRNENPEKTGFAHLFEHLMFGGSVNVPSFDEPLQKVGGENNAFTNTDITNYYTTVPANNAETAFWLESDRMMGLSFEQRILDREKSVVIEEFKQRYLNQPYGDAWLKMRPVAYETHSYAWPTIGKEISHIENATMDDVRSFFGQHYRPSNAVLVIAGGITIDKSMELAQKWFGPIKDQESKNGSIVPEVKQEEARHIDHYGDVPQNAVYQAYHMPGRGENGYIASDLLSDILGRGKSSLLHQHCVKKNQIFSSITAHVMGTIDPGLFVISGKLNPDKTHDEGAAAIDETLAQFDRMAIDEPLQKVKSMAEASMVFGEVELLNRAMSLAMATFMNNTNLVNEELSQIQSITAEEVREMRQEVLRKTNCTTMYYHKNNQE